LINPLLHGKGPFHTKFRQPCLFFCTGGSLRMAVEQLFQALIKRSFCVTKKSVILRWYLLNPSLSPPGPAKMSITGIDGQALASEANLIQPSFAYGLITQSLSGHFHKYDDVFLQIS
jgi:hypothetical protein